MPQGGSGLQKFQECKNNLYIEYLPLCHEHVVSLHTVFNKKNKKIVHSAKQQNSKNTGRFVHRSF